MNNINYDKKMQEIIGALKQKKKLLLHACCAPCTTSCLPKLTDNFLVTIYFYNPNIDTLQEYLKREEEIKKLCKIFSLDYIVEPYSKEDFISISKGLEKEPERGKRCDKCFRLRLEKTAKKGKQLGFDYFATTLTLSPLKSAKLINQIGQELEEETGLKYLCSDFKKRGGYLQSINLSKEYNLYRQNYCGCEFSKNK